MARLPDDTRWHRARLEALHAAGMDSWIEAEYVRADLSPAVAATFAIWEVDVGRRLGLPPELHGPGVEVARGRVALRTGDREGAARIARADDDLDHRSLLAEVTATSGDGDAIVAALADWPEEDPRASQAPLYRACTTTRAAKACAARLDAVRADATTSEDVLSLLDAADLGVRLGDTPLLAAVDARLRALGLPTDVQSQMDGFSGGPERWVAWSVPPRARLAPAELDALGASLAARGSTTVPWGRPDERRRIAVALAEGLQARKQVLQADRVLAEVFGPCAPSVQPEVLVATGHGLEGRELAVDRLLGCLGGTDLVPDDDPAGLEIDARIDDVADGWYRFGRVAEIGRWDEDAALAFALAARLSPDPEVVARARLQAKAVGWAVDASGLPSVADLVGRLGSTLLLRPAQALLATRAERARARTVAWLDPTPEHLAARVTPENLCLPTLRSRCHLERAVAELAFTRAHLPVPDDLPRATDAGARLAAGGVLDRLVALGFQRRADLVRRLETEVPRDLTAILAGRTGAGVGFRAPRWTSGGIRAADLDGRVVVLIFWAGWSRPSLPELLMVDGLARAWDREDLPVRVLGVSVDTSNGAYQRALSNLEVDATTLLRDVDLRGTFHVDEVPTIVVVDAAGVLRERRSGYDGGDLGWLDATVRSWSALAPRSR